MIQQIQQDRLFVLRLSLFKVFIFEKRFTLWYPEVELIVYIAAVCVETELFLVKTECCTDDDSATSQEFGFIMQLVLFVVIDVSFDSFSQEFCKSPIELTATQFG